MARSARAEREHLRAQLRSAGRSPAQIAFRAVRLAVNEQARSLAKMGDHDAAARAVDHAWTVIDHHDRPHHGLTASLNTGIYCQARTAGNTAVWADRIPGNLAQLRCAIIDSGSLRSSRASLSCVRQ